MSIFCTSWCYKTSKRSSERSSKREILKKILTILCSNYCTPSYYISRFLKIESWDIITWDIKLHNVGPNLSQITQLCENMISREKWLIILFSIYYLLSWQNFSKKLCDRSWDITLNNFGPNWVQILFFFQKGIF